MKELEFIRTFSLDDLKFIQQENTDDVDFFIGRLGFLASGWNGQDCYINEDVLKQYANTVLGKFITAKYDVWQNDVMSHEKDLNIIGYVPKDADITFERLDDGRLMAYTECVLSKIYCYNIYKMFKMDNYRAVSVEFSSAMPDDAPLNDKGEKVGEITAFQIHSVTILGKKIPPAVKDANLQIIKFSAKQAEDVFERLKSISNNAIDNNTTNGKEVKMQEDEKKLSAPQEDGEKQLSEENVEMADKQTESDASTDSKEEKDDKKLSDEESQKQEDPKEDDNEMSEANKECADSEGELSDKECAKKECADKECSDNKECADNAEDDKKSDDSESEGEDKQEEEKSEDKEMSLDVFADNGALLAMLAEETEENRDFCTKLFDSKDINLIMSKVLSLKKENDNYKAEKEMAEAKECAKKFAQCMGSVKLDLDEDTYSKLYSEGKEIKQFSAMDAFEAKVKALAYDNSKKKHEQNEADSDVFRYAASFDDNKQDTDVFSRLEKKYN